MAGEKMLRSAGSTANARLGRQTTRPCSSSGATLAAGERAAVQVECVLAVSRLTVLLRRPTATAAGQARYRRYQDPLRRRCVASWSSSPLPTRGALPFASAFPAAHAPWRVSRAWVWSDLPRMPPQVFSTLSPAVQRGGARRARRTSRRWESAMRLHMSTGRCQRPADAPRACYLAGSAKAVAVNPDGRNTHWRPSIMYVVGGPKMGAPV